jgi:sortase (surface protein transpeptidase)
MSRLHLSLLLIVLLLSGCGAPIYPINLADKTFALPTPAIADSAGIATPNHALIDTPILDDPADTPRAVTPSPAQPRTPAQPPSPTRAPPPPTPARQHIVSRLVIEDIALDRPLVPVGLDTDTRPIVPKHDPGWFVQSGTPGQGDNIVLWGHALRFRDSPSIPAPFGRLNQLQLGARVVLYDDQGTAFPYAVTQQVWVTPDQVAYILPTGKERVTMVSCIGDQVIGRDGKVVNMTHRLITIAEPKQS